MIRPSIRYYAWSERIPTLCSKVRFFYFDPMPKWKVLLLAFHYQPDGRNSYHNQAESGVNISCSLDKIDFSTQSNLADNF